MTWTQEQIFTWKSKNVRCIGGTWRVSHFCLRFELFQYFSIDICGRNCEIFVKIHKIWVDQSISCLFSIVSLSNASSSGWHCMTVATVQNMCHVDTRHGYKLSVNCHKTTWHVLNVMKAISFHKEIRSRGLIFSCFPSRK